ncbi:uncharacterized protein V1510DRAFT_423511 [Dipodascopsis tothii]|uniref:uncharacterized protein n=1 Tax=Dipodascopsis tothii TaxID=44089 RepID=UPI0034CE26AD
MEITSSRARALYRSVWRLSMRAIRKSSPQRYYLRRILRNFFTDPEIVYEPVKFENTLLFLEAAEKYRGLEHKILKNLLHVAWSRRMAESKRPNTPITDKVRFKQELSDVVLLEFDNTQRLLGESVNIYVPYKPKHYAPRNSERSRTS